MQIYRWLQGRPPPSESIARLTAAHAIQLASHCDRPYRIDPTRAAQRSAPFGTAHAQSSSPWTAGEPRKNRILPEGVHEIVEAFQAFVSPA